MSAAGATTRQFTILNPKIVNGLQTSTEIYNYFSDNPLAIEEEKRNTALSMLADNEPVNKIAKYTGLTLETINELKENMNNRELA